MQTRLSENRAIPEKILMIFLELKVTSKPHFRNIKQTCLLEYFDEFNFHQVKKSLQNLRFESLNIYINYGGFCTLILY